ncbi:hypothetical protein D9757_002194 [Collybiopsis confluens]|uniref:ATP11-domain-containing protein n=1 Tax=Collybiopsis confluens TaxID=2823264 RepID=A0A8H5HZZ3_9AGAR|nr:hypothetical protein D9757_002194 [Collybiopsis confluens]
MLRHVSTRRAALSSFRRGLHSDWESKYAQKLRLRAEKQGLNVNQLKENAKEVLQAERKRLSDANAQAIRAKKSLEEKTAETSSAPRDFARTDSSPVKPLGSILNLPKIASVNPTQVSALWTAYHASRSDGTGRGYLCASIPLESYERMAAVGAKYPSFVLPVSRPNAQVESSESADTPHEFYFMQWGFHEAPPVPPAAEPDPFIPPTHTAQSPEGFSNPSTSTILLTPLQEFKLRNSYATPYLVLTHYTDLAKTHGIVLLRGEITPGSGNDGRYLLSQEDAQILSLGVQKFYLWSDSKGSEKNNESTGETILKKFHEKPLDFDWQEMLKYSTRL